MYDLFETGRNDGTGDEKKEGKKESLFCGPSYGGENGSQSAAHGLIRPLRERKSSMCRLQSVAHLLQRGGQQVRRDRRGLRREAGAAGAAARRLLLRGRAHGEVVTPRAVVRSNTSWRAGVRRVANW